MDKSNDKNRNTSIENIQSDSKQEYNLISKEDLEDDAPIMVQEKNIAVDQTE